MNEEKEGGREEGEEIGKGREVKDHMNQPARPIEMSPCKER